jgi:hypothetical protein
LKNGTHIFPEVDESAMPDVLEKRSVAASRREAALRAEVEELERIKQEMLAGNYVTLDEWERKNGYDSRTK